MAEPGSLPDCYLINLTSRPERLERATARLETAGIPFTRFEAITSQSAQSTPFSNVAHDLRGRVFGPGIHGCAASHLTLYSKLLESDSSWMLILEDDLLPVDDAGSRIRHAFQGSCDQADVIQFGWLGFHRTYKSRMKDLQHRVAGRGARSDGLVESNLFRFGTHCYAVNRRFAERALDYRNPIFNPIDVMIRLFVQAGGVRLLRHWPPLAVQDASASDIADNRIHGMSCEPRW